MQAARQLVPCAAWMQAYVSNPYVTDFASRTELGRCGARGDDIVFPVCECLLRGLMSESRGKFGEAMRSVVDP
jgi:hypothetical protein